jgi:predicted XRE-type DNA-binding protein
MKSRRATNNISIIEGSGNVFADLRLPDAEDLRFKAELARQICNRIKKLGLNQVQTAARLGLKQPDVSKLMNGRHIGFSADRLISLLSKLQVDVDIVLRPRLKFAGPRGIIRVREAAG